MKEDWLNKKLEEKFEDFESPMDLENAWELLQARRQKPKKKNRFFFFWLIFGLAVVGVGGSYLLSTSLSDRHSAAAPIAITEADHLSKNENQRFEKTESTTNILPTTKTTNQPNADINKSIKTKAIQNTSKNISYENQNAVHPTTTIVEGNTSFSKTENNASVNVITSDNNLDFIEQSNTNSIFTTQNEEGNTSAIESDISLKEEQPIAILFLPSLEMSLLDFPQKENSEKWDALFLGSTSTVFPPMPMEKNYFQISAGYGIHSKGKVFINEKALDVFSVNALFEKRLRNKKIYFKTGLTFDQFVNSIETITEQSYTEQADNQLIRINKYKNGTVENIYGISDIQVLERTTSNTFNRYQLLSIPIILGYDVITAKKVSLQIEGGIARSIFGSYTGRTFDLIDSDLEKQGVWQGLYGLNFNYKLGTRTHTFTSLKGNYHLNTIGKSEQLNMEKFSFHQVQLGLRFKL